MYWWSIVQLACRWENCQLHYVIKLSYKCIYWSALPQGYLSSLQGRKYIIFCRKHFHITRMLLIGCQLKTKNGSTLPQYAHSDKMNHFYYHILILIVIDLIIVITIAFDIIVILVGIIVQPKNRKVFYCILRLFLFPFPMYILLY